MPDYLHLDIQLPPVLQLRLLKPPAVLPADMAEAIVGKSGVAAISTDPGNRATLGADSGVYVRDDLVPDPLAYYILAKA